MTDDQQFILALCGVVTTAVSSAVVYIRTNQTHALVDGIGKKNVRRARAIGKKAGAAAADAARTPVPLRQDQNAP